MTIWWRKRKLGEAYNPLKLLFEVSMGMEGRKPWFRFMLPFFLLGVDLFPRDRESNIEGWNLRLYLLPNIGRTEGEWMHRFEWIWRIGKQVTREQWLNRRPPLEKPPLGRKPAWLIAERWGAEVLKWRKEEALRAVSRSYGEALHSQTGGKRTPENKAELQRCIDEMGELPEWPK